MNKKRLQEVADVIMYELIENGGNSVVCFDKESVSWISDYFKSNDFEVQNIQSEVNNVFKLKYDLQCISISLSRYRMPNKIYRKLTEKERSDLLLLDLSGLIMYENDGSITVLSGAKKFEDLATMIASLISKYK